VATIVVGEDGSDSAQKALHFAVKEARLRGAGVRAVMAVNIATMTYGPMSGFGPDGPGLDPTEFEEDLLAVGSRRQGGFKGLLLGSVSHQCALHVPCPVVIVHARKPDNTAQPLPKPIAEARPRT
jgi:nucleotide-binding universal stress UspA family protein